MSIISIVFTAIGLAMDAIAVSLTIGLRGTKDEKNKLAIKAGLYFGGFQALMPFMGWLLGIKFTKYIESVDHWIAFILLSWIGIKMLIDSIKGEEEEELDIHSNKKFLLLAVATSIDALAIGVSFAFLNINIISSIAIIGLVTFALSMIAVYLGEILGGFLQKKAGIIGGIILIFIGINILCEHLNLF